VSGVINGGHPQPHQSAPGSAVTLTIAPDVSKASDVINQIRLAYNTVIKDINSSICRKFSTAPVGARLEADGSARELNPAFSPRSLLK